MNISNLVSNSPNETHFLSIFRSNVPEGIIWGEDHEILLKTYYALPDLIPAIKGLDESVVVNKWFKKYKKGKDSRPSLRVSNLPGTVPDPIIEQIIKTKLGHLNSDDLNNVTFAHRLAMSAENILGLLLEEYLSMELADYGWYCCWDSIVKHVDFINIDGSLLQVKNRSNSENSSSVRVRDNRPILKWHRVDANNGNYRWHELNTKLNTDRFSEESFEEFVRQTIRNNPAALAVEDANPWSSNR